jgi:hypothetical protein
MSDDQCSIGERFGRYLPLAGVIVLIAWFALLRAMFGDVL